MQKILVKFQWDHFQLDAKCRWGRKKGWTKSNYTLEKEQDKNIH